MYSMFRNLRELASSAWRLGAKYPHAEIENFNQREQEIDHFHELFKWQVEKENSLHGLSKPENFLAKKIIGFAKASVNTKLRLDLSRSLKTVDTTDPFPNYPENPSFDDFQIARPRTEEIFEHAQNKIANILSELKQNDPFSSHSNVPFRIKTSNFDSGFYNEHPGDVIQVFEVVQYNIPIGSRESFSPKELDETQVNRRFSEIIGAEFGVKNIPAAAQQKTVKFQPQLYLNIDN